MKQSIFLIFPLLFDFPFLKLHKTYYKILTIATWVILLDLILSKYSLQSLHLFCKGIGANLDGGAESVEIVYKKTNSKKQSNFTF